MDNLHEQAIKDLKIEKLDKETQDTIIGSFFRGLQAKIQLTLIDGMTDEQQKEFADISDEKEKDVYMEKLVGGDMDAFVDGIYKESVEEFNSSADAMKSGLNSTK